MSLDPNFWNDSKAAEKMLKELKAHKDKVKQYTDIETVLDDLEVLFEFLKDGMGTEEEVAAKYLAVSELIEETEMKTTLNKPEDEMSAIVEINAGAGGTEACDWAEMLERMYLMWGEKSGHKVSAISRVDGDVAGIKSVSLELTGDMVYGYLKGENGVHRLVRISPFNSQGKRMTSFASVFVHPVIDDTIEIEVNTADLSWDTFRASGAGGQHVNKTESAVRVRHAPSGVVVECQQERSQHLNREKALKVLKSRLYELEVQKQLEERDAVESQKMKNEWGSQIRSYVLDDRRVKDHRSNYQTSQTDAVLAGDLDAFLKATLMYRSGKKSE
ncbi:MAG: peptide chain release factor 2 [Saprospiraceae bacterium]|jgi:peptide chain release factor 2